MAAIMPERLAATPASSSLTEMVGSGPFRYLASERVPGARNVYAKFAQYVPRQGTASFCAGPRLVHFDRVEWITTPDPATQVAALKSGEVDFVEQPLMDLVPSLQANRALKVEVVETKGLIGFLRFNQTFPPFDNPAIRRAVLKAVNQKEFMEAVVGANAPYDSQCGIFTTGTPMANDAGMAVLSGGHDAGDLRRELTAAGYKGETEDKRTQLALARKIQEQALQDVPYLPLGSYYQPVAYKANLTGVPKGLVQFTGIRRG